MPRLMARARNASTQCANAGGCAAQSGEAEVRVESAPAMNVRRDKTEPKRGENRGMPQCSHHALPHKPFKPGDCRLG